ncbi:MAG: hypothetical protein AB7C89_00920, partial [Intestinibacillus sp.]
TKKDAKVAFYVFVNVLYAVSVWIALIIAMYLRTGQQRYALFMVHPDGQSALFSSSGRDSTGFTHIP